MSLLDKVIINIYYIYEQLTNTYCDHCGEITIDGECDFCD